MTFAQGPGAFLGLPQCRQAALAVTRHCRYTVLVCVLCTGVYSEQQQLCLFPSCCDCNKSTTELNHAAERTKLFA